MEEVSPVYNDSSHLKGIDNFTRNIFLCHFVDLPEDTRTQCSESDPEICVKCPILGKYLTGGTIADFGSTGHIVTLAEWVFTLFIGIFGILANFLIITVFTRRENKRSFDWLLIALASFDLIASFASVVGSTTAIAMLEGWGRHKGLFVQVLTYYGCGAALFAKSASSFMTVMITAERYLVLAFPFQAKTWFTRKGSFLMIGFIFVFATLLNIPRFSSFHIVYNDFGKDIPALKDFDYVALTSPLQSFWYGTMRGFFDKIDFWVWPPLLIFLNVLVFYQVWGFSKRRKQLTHNQKKDISAVKMFLPVVVALFVCNVEPYIHYYYISVNKTFSREHYLGLYLSICVNSSVNLPIYYFKGSRFRRELKELVFIYSNGIFCKELNNGKERKKSTISSSVASSTISGQ